MRFFSMKISKVEKAEDGQSVYVYGKATGPDLDLDDQIIDQDFAKKAVGDWFTDWANVRQMHSTSLAPAGKAMELNSLEDGEWIGVKVVEPGAMKLTEEGVYSAFSIGISRPRIIRDATAKNGRIIDGVVTEVSLVDYPANPTCKFVQKAASIAVEDGVEKAADWTAFEHELLDDVHKAEIADLTKNLAEEVAAAPIIEAVDLTETAEPAVAAVTAEDAVPAAQEPVVEPVPETVAATVPPTPTLVDPPPAPNAAPELPAEVQLGEPAPAVEAAAEAEIEKAGDLSAAGEGARVAIHATLAATVAADAGTGEECYDIEWLSDLYCSICSWVACAEWEEIYDAVYLELAAKPAAEKFPTLLKHADQVRDFAKTKPATVEKAADVAALVAAEVAKAMTERDDTIAKLSAQVAELGAQPDPSMAPLRGGTGGTVPVTVIEDTEDGEIQKAETGTDPNADYRLYLTRMTKHSSPEIRIRATETLEALGAAEIQK